MLPPTPFALSEYRRGVTPDLEVAPREPVFAVGLISPKEVPFVLVREAIGSDHVGSMVAWLVWRGDACVGYVGATLGGLNPFAGGAPLASRKAFSPHRAVAIWRTHIVDGSGHGHGAHVLARVPSRRLGIMSSAYVEIIRQLSAHGWALRSTPKARSADAKALWGRLHATPAIVVLKRRAPAGEMREFAFMLAGAPTLAVPGPTVARP